MSNQIVKALEHGAQKLGKTLAEDAGKALKGFYRKAGDNLKTVAKNTREIEEKHAKDLAKIMRGEGKDGVPHPRSGSSRSGRSGSGRGRMREGVQDPRKTGVRLNSRNTCSDPVDVSSGEVVLGEVDVSLLATLPLVLHRTHISSYRAGQWFGPSWASTLDQRLELDEDGVVFASEDGMLLCYPRPEPGVPVLPVEGPRWPLLWDAERGRIDITDPVLGQRRAFAALPGESLDFAQAMELPLQEIGDRNGNLIEVLYGVGGAPTEVRHSAGYRIGVHTRGNRITGFDLLGPDAPESASGPAADASSGSAPAAAPGPGGEGALRLVEFGFDGNGNLVRVVNSSALAQEFTYDEHHRITTWCDRNQHRYRYLYDRVGRCVQTRGDGGFLDAVFSYDTERRTTKVTNALGHTTTYLINDFGQTVAETDPLGAHSTFVWDRYDRLLSSTDPLGRTTELAYDADGNLAHTRRPDGSTQSAAYNDRHQVVASVLPDGSRWAFDYDERGNLLAQTDPTGTTLHYRRDTNGHLSAITDANGAVTAITTDRAGLPIAITDPGGATSYCVRDGFGRPVEITEEPGRTTCTTWTVEGRLASRTHPDGTTEHWTYDPEGNLLEHRDAAGRATRYEYTYFDLVRARTDVNGARYEFTYDAELHLTRITAPDGLTWTYEFDATGRPARERDFNGRTLTYTHDAAGQLVARTNGAGQRIDYRHDLLGRPVEQRTDDGAVTHFAYDPMGRLLEAGNPTTTVHLRYDPAGRLLSESVAGRTTHFGYDLLGRRTTRRTPTGVETAWTYDPLGQPLTMTTAGRTLRFGYDPTGREIHRDLGALRIGHARDINDRVVAQDLTLWNGPAGSPGTQPLRNLVHRSYRLRDDDTPVAITDSRQGDLTIAADPAGRPTALAGWSGPESYAYDQAGRPLHAQWPSTPASAATDTAGERHYSGGLLHRAGRTSYEHDAQGRVVRQSRRLLSGGEKTWHYTWDAEDRLTHLTTPDGTCWRYLYDPLGRRTAKQRLAPDLATVVEETLFTWDGPVLVEQTRTTADHDHARTTTWEWDPDTFRPLTQSEHSHPLRSAPQDVVDARFYAIVTDLVGTPTELVDENGDVAWHSRTTLWGIPLEQADGPGCPLAFPGQYRDTESGLHYNLYRYYEPLTGRYLTPDPLGLDPAPDPYSYVHNPQTWADPLGLAPCMQALEDMAKKINKVLSPRGQEGQTVAAIHVDTPHGPKVFVAGTSKAKLTPAQRDLAVKLGAIPLPNDQYMKIAKGEKGGHAEQNLLLFFDRMHRANGGSSWEPTHGGASRSVCTDFCAPIVRGTGGRMDGPTYPKENGTHRRQFYWPGKI